jgi:hypothetical protein
VEFTLYYRGPLKATTRANTRVREKHDLRRYFHKQLKELWNQKPLSEYPEFLEHNKRLAIGLGTDDTGDYADYEDITLLRQVREFQFVPTVSSDLNMVADLTITLLRPEEPGSIITQGGDIDNRLKTLLDSLKVPEADEIPTDEAHPVDETPFFCSVEDDNLITSLGLTTDRLLDSSADSSEVILLIHVRTRVLRGNFANLGLI